MSPVCPRCGRLACDCAEMVGNQRVRLGYHRDCAFCDALLRTERRMNTLSTLGEVIGPAAGIILVIGYVIWMLSLS